MTPLSETTTELRLVVALAEDMAPGVGAPHPHLEDFRTEVIGELMDVLDRLDCGLGTRLMLALYPLASALRSDR